MRAYHDSRRLEFRDPFGAVTPGQTVLLRLDCRDDPGAICDCLIGAEGTPVQRIAMNVERREDFMLFSCQFSPDRADLYWYRFVLTGSDGRSWHYGVKAGRSGGEGQLEDYEVSPFQLTVYEAVPIPQWYSQAIVYQIFPDSFCRGTDWQTLTAKALDLPRKGPSRALRPSWDAVPAYEKDAAGRVTRWDFFGGTLSGIMDKLDYLRDLGITAIYLNPIFEAASCHRYDTGDYLKINPMLGDETIFINLCAQAQAKGISIILDGVFSHTGCDSLYFNKYGNFNSLGAWQSPDSPYRSWYRFDGSAIGYECWWGVDDLPNLEENDPSYRDFICGADGVVASWLRRGARGWRLDVADELPDDFIAAIRSAVRSTCSDAIVLGEVWEDASNKRSYGQLRRYLLGDELDSVMNYPFRDNILNFLLGHVGAGETADRFCSLYENYPHDAFYGALNILGSHDRPRILTLLGGAPDESTQSESDRAGFRLSPEQRQLGMARLWLATLLQMTFPGVPCVYYGDEAGLEGYSDPFNRAAYPWGDEDSSAADITREGIALRRADPLFVSGGFQPFAQTDDVFGFYRFGEHANAVMLVNRCRDGARAVELPTNGLRVAELVTGHLAVTDDRVTLTLPPLGAAVVYLSKGPSLGRPLAPGRGVLCHITSIPDGCLGAPARRFVDLLADAGQRYWQVLPLTTTDEIGSPYAGFSAFAGSIPLLGQDDAALMSRFTSFDGGSAFDNFCALHADWLNPYCAYAAIRALFPDQPWQNWPKEYNQYNEALAKNPKLAANIRFHAFCQFEFSRAWTELRDYAHAKGVLIIGDLPMYVAENSADTWSRPELFRLDSNGRATQIAGVPPDYFSPDGQLWNNPVFDWDYMKNEGFDWWLRRLARAFELYDAVRLDHFRGFESYWSIPVGRTALDGRWLPGPGFELFQAAFDRFGPLPIIAEDLGRITPAVRALVARCGFPGMEVMQFADTDVRADHYPVLPNKIAYSGTHDNQTLVGWCAQKYPGEEPHRVAGDLIDRLSRSDAEVVIIPLQDLLGLGDEARMNAPGTTSGNWQWRADEDALTNLVLTDPKSKCRVADVD